MGKGANKQLLSNSGVAQGRSNSLDANSRDLYGFLDPTLIEEATNPQGYGAKDLAAMNTASQQSLGGSTAGITGEANLESARTRNAGGFQGAVGAGARSNARQLSQNAVDIQGQNARLKEAQKQTALSQLEQLYGIDTATALKYLDTSNTALEGENKSSGLNSLTDQYLLGAQKAAGQAAAAGG